MEQADLFADDEALRLRDKKGRFATPERAYADRILAENERLNLELAKYKRLYEKFFRAWQAVSNHNSALQRKMIQLKELISK